MLTRLVAVIVAEADGNSDFSRELDTVLNLAPKIPKPEKAVSTRGKARRADAILDPIAIVREGGETALRARLAFLTLDQLKDVIAQYDMDPAKTLLKRKTAGGMIDVIATLAVQRASKGAAFL